MEGKGGGSGAELGTGPQEDLRVAHCYSQDGSPTDVSKLAVVELGRFLRIVSHAQLAFPGREAWEALAVLLFRPCNSWIWQPRCHVGITCRPEALRPRLTPSLPIQFRSLRSNFQTISIRNFEALMHRRYLANRAFVGGGDLSH